MMNFISKTVKAVVFMAFSALFAPQALGNQVQVVEPETRKKVVLWDLGYVLLKPNQAKMSGYILPRTCGINPWNLVRLGMLYKYGCLTPKGIQTTMDNVLHNARPEEPRQTVIVNQHGEPHANIDCDHSSGTLPDKELFAQAQESIRKLDAADKLKSKFDDLFFKNAAHKYLVEKTLQLRFMAPKLFGESFTPIPQGVDLLEKCVKSGAEMAILSNWGAESFPYMQAYAPNNVIFKHVKPENIFASGKIKLSKPYPQAYEHVIETMKVQPEDCIFIDDQIKNIEAARAVGMHAIHLTDYKNPEAYKAVETELQRLGAL